MSTVQLIGIVGSLRTGSVHSALAGAAREAVPDDAMLTIHDVGDVALYNGDAERDGPPPSVRALREAVDRADGIVFFSPEYNTSLPAVTKNVIDWLSRDPAVWDGTGITMVSMSPGGRAGIGAREHFSAIMERQAPNPFETLGFGRYGERMDDDGNVTDAATLDELTGFLERFVEHCRAASDAR